MVYAPLEVRVERAMKRDCSSRELVLKRIEAQMSDEAKREQADFVQTQVSPYKRCFATRRTKNGKISFPSM